MFQILNLSDTGKQQACYTSRSTFREMDSCGLSSGFTDLSVDQKLYNIRMSVNKSPHWQKNEEEEGINTVVSRSWDNQFSCLHCTPKHSIFNKEIFGLIICNQHNPSKVPAYDGDCLATIRLHNLSLSQLVDITLHQIVRGLENRSKVRCSDEHGAAEVLQTAIRMNLEIYVFFTRQVQDLSLIKLPVQLTRCRGPSSS